MKWNKTQARNTLLLVLASVIWGMAFVAQSVGSEYMGAYTFLAARSWLACLFLMSWIVIRHRIALHKENDKKNHHKKTFGTAEAAEDAVRRSQAAEDDQGAGQRDGIPLWREPRQLVIGGVLCGTFLFLASAVQQMGIGNTDSTAKAGFLTALYVVMVPLVQQIGGKRAGVRLWICVGISLAGLYLLCLAGKGSLALTGGEWQLLFCALLFTCQIIAVGIYSPRVDVIQLSFAEFFVTAILATIFMIGKESPDPEQLRSAAVAIAYCGILSSGIGYTLQTLAQKELDPTIASLAMCLESVFSALGGFLILHQSLSAQELAGCVLMFAAISGAQLPGRRR